jgi:putative two-component system response regulator
LNAADLDTLSKGAVLHDVGKIALPDAVLLKPGRLNAEELSLMREHPVVGDNLCRTIRALDRVRPIVRWHHERQDGRGYPDGLQGDEIPLLAQIVAVVDVFDALTTNRPYRTAMTAKGAYDILLSDAASGWCSAALVKTFVDLHRRTFPHISFQPSVRPISANVARGMLPCAQS